MEGKCQLSIELLSEEGRIRCLGLRRERLTSTMDLYLIRRSCICSASRSKNLRPRLGNGTGRAEFSHSNGYCAFVLRFGCCIPLSLNPSIILEQIMTSWTAWSTFVRRFFAKRSSACNVLDPDVKSYIQNTCGKRKFFHDSRCSCS